jgi:uncharacterized membrane protein YeaQ/YmgE (transglycosylase-associated protein family)
MWIIEAALIGFVVGLLARILTPGRHPRGLFVTIAIGIAGATIATIGGHLAGWYASGQSAGFLASLVGAIVLLLALRAIGDRRS